MIIEIIAGIINRLWMANFFEKEVSIRLIRRYYDIHFFSKLYLDTFMYNKFNNI